MNAKSNSAFACQGAPQTAVQQNKTIFLSSVKAQLNHHLNVILFGSSRVFCSDASNVNAFRKQGSKNTEVEGKDRRQGNAAYVFLKILWWQRWATTHDQTQRTHNPEAWKEAYSRPKNSVFLDPNPFWQTRCEPWIKKDCSNQRLKRFSKVCLLPTAICA